MFRVEKHFGPETNTLWDAAAWQEAVFWPHTVLEIFFFANPNVRVSCFQTEAKAFNDFAHTEQCRAVVGSTFFLLRLIGLSYDRLQQWRSSLCSWCQPIANHLLVPRYNLPSYKMFKGTNCHPARAHQEEKKKKCQVWWRFLFNSVKASSQSADQHFWPSGIQPTIQWPILSI